MSSQPLRIGAALEYTEKILGGTVLEVDNVISVATTKTTLVNNNGDRVGLIIANMGAGNIYIAPDPSVATNKGIPLASGATAVILLPFDFTLTSREWDAVSDGGGPYSVFILEFVRQLGS